MIEENVPVARDFHDPNGYRIRCGFIYPVYRQEFGGHVFYKMPVSKKMADGSRLTAYKSVSFRNKEKDCNIKDGTLIIPLKMYEDFYFNKNDTQHYNPMFTLVITDWTEKQTEVQQRNEALEDYKTSLEVEDIDFNDEDIPF